MPAKVLSPEEKARKREHALKVLKKANEALQRRQELKIDKVIQFIALNPFASLNEACREAGLTINPENKARIHNLMAQPATQDKINAYKSEYVSPMVSQDIGERYRTLAIQAVNKAQERLFSKDCKDNTLVEILRVCSQYLAPKNAAVNINAGAGSLVGILSDLQSSAQEALTKLPEKTIEPD